MLKANLKVLGSTSGPMGPHIQVNLRAVSNMVTESGKRDRLTRKAKSGATHTKACTRMTKSTARVCSSGSQAIGTRASI